VGRHLKYIRLFSVFLKREHGKYFTFPDSKSLSHFSHLLGKASLSYDYTPHSEGIKIGHWPPVRKTWLGHACWSEDNEARKWEIFSCLIYSGPGHTVKRCAIFWKHQLLGICFREVPKHIVNDKSSVLFSFIFLPKQCILKYRLFGWGHI
jgi:hypothetical protein